LSSRLLFRKLKIKLYRTIILPVILYGCKTWSITLGEEHRLRVSENRVLRIFESGREGGTQEMVRGRRRLHNEELRNLQEDEMGGYVAHTGEIKVRTKFWSVR
jgi:hypothetical protein